MATKFFISYKWSRSVQWMGSLVLVFLLMAGCGDRKNPVLHGAMPEPAAKKGGAPVGAATNAGETAYTMDAGDGTFGGYNEANCPDYGITTYTLWAGKTNDAGTVSITNDEDNLYVTYNTNGTADLKEVHVYVWDNQEDIPDKRPAPGQAPYTAENLYVDEYTLTIPWTWEGSPCGQTLYVSTHAALVADGVDGDDQDDGTLESNDGETGYAGGANTPDGFTSAKGAWWGYVTFEVSCFYDISGTVYQDADNSGDLESQETPFSGIVVSLLDGDGNVVETTTTDEEGHYVFEHLPQGNDYSVVVEEGPADHIANENAEGFSTGTLDECKENIDFGFVPVYDISGTIYRDADCSEDFEEGETGIAGVEIALLDTAGSVIATVETEADGTYLFEDILAGDYQVSVEALPDYVPSENAEGYAVENLSSDLTDVDFGFCPVFDLSGTVYADADCGSSLGGSDAGIEGVLVTLLSGEGITLTTVTTNVDGSYIFEDLLTGDYEIVVDTPDDFAASENAAGYAVENLSSDLTDIDFGFCPLYDLSGVVYEDDACDSAFDGVDVGMAGLLVTLLDEYGVELSTTTTDADGAYLFENLVAGGSYRVEVETPADYTPAEGSGGYETGVLTSDLTDIDFGFCPPSVDPCELDPTAEECGGGGGGDDGDHETAYAFGNLEFCGDGLGLTRWGWVNEIAVVPGESGSITQPIYAGAGQCDTSKGTYIGTLTIEWVAGANEVTVTASHQIDGPYHVDTTHTWIDFDLPDNIIANGNFTVVNDNDQVSSDSASVTLSFTPAELAEDNILHVIAHMEAGGF